MPKILDCTLRDGGLVNDSNFSADFARAALDACEAAGIDIVEVSFRNGENFFSPDKFGKLRFCKESDLREIFGDKPRKTKLCALADAGKSAPFPPRDKSVISRMRCAFYAENIDKALELLESAADDGYETSACMMAAPQIDESTRTKCLERLAESKIDTIYLMDSFGTLTPAEAENNTNFTTRQSSFFFSFLMVLSFLNFRFFRSEKPSPGGRWLARPPQARDG